MQPTSLLSLSRLIRSMASFAGTAVSISGASPRSSSLRQRQVVKGFSGLISFSSQTKSFPSLCVHRFRVSCAAKPETVEKVCEIVRKQLALAADASVTGESKFTSLGADSLDTGKEARMAVRDELIHSWRFDQNSGLRRSPWLLSTLADLEEKTKGMLKLMEEDADSFAKRAEMYYKKRPELTNMIGDLYRAHRSLAERYDQIRLERGRCRTASVDSSFLNKSWMKKLKETTDESSGSSSVDSEDSEVDDPEPESEVESRLKVVSNKKDDDDDDSHVVKVINGEIERLKEENVALKAELATKDHEKREVIRQLSMSVDILKEDNHYLKKCIKDSNKWGVLFEFKKLTEGIFSGKLFGGVSKSRTTTLLAL